MIFVRLKKDGINYESIHFKPFDSIYGMGKTKEELEQEGYLIEEPLKEHIEGKEAVLKRNPQTNTFYYDYVDRPLSDEEKMKQLEERNARNEQAIIELTALVGGMTNV